MKREAAARLRRLEARLARRDNPAAALPTAEALVLGTLDSSSTDLRVSDISRRTGLSDARVRARLNDLVDEGLVWESSGKRSEFKAGHWTKKKVPRVYTVAHGVRAAVDTRLRDYYAIVDAQGWYALADLAAALEAGEVHVETQ